MGQVNRRSGGSVILCVDDELDLLADIIDELNEAGYTTLAANNGMRALELLREHVPALILCDISMPVMNGFELLEATQAMGVEYAHIPFVFLTAFSSTEDVIKGKLRGADDYLIKPIDFDLLLATITARLRQVERLRHAYTTAATQVRVRELTRQFKLTPMETRVVLTLASGKTLTEIAHELQVARSTIAFHMRNIFQKTQTGRQTELVALLYKQEDANRGSD